MAAAFPMVSTGRRASRSERHQDTVLARTMPPWGAVKGSVSCATRGDVAAEIDLIVEWVDTGTPTGRQRAALPERPALRRQHGRRTEGCDRRQRRHRARARRQRRGLKPGRVAPDASLRSSLRCRTVVFSQLVWLYSTGATMRIRFGSRSR
jgi:hypothetical protein